MTGERLLLEEHVDRLFEGPLRERGDEVEQLKDRVGEPTTDADLLEWCAGGDVVLVTNSAKDFEPRHEEYDHAGMLLYRDQRLPDRNPEGLARSVDAVFDQYATADPENELVGLEECVHRLQG